MIRRQSLPLTLCAAVLGAGLAPVAFAHDVALEGPIEIPEGSTAYVTADGEAVRTGGGECLRLTTFDEDNQVDACEGIEEVVEAPDPEPEPLAPPPEPTVRVELRQLDERALFEFDSADLTMQGEAEVAELLQELERYEGVTEITVTGHTDSVGADEYNQSLSELRAATVGALMTAVYPEARITLVGLGESAPIATNDTPEGRQMNRRVEIELTAAETVTLN